MFQLVLFGLGKFSQAGHTNEPVIGILTQELLPSLEAVYHNYSSYIAASYVKAVEGSGARVVPILIGQNFSYYKKLISMVNGVVLPGGDCRFDVRKGYAEAAAAIYKLAIQANKKSDYFPIFGVCLGFQVLLHLGNGGKELRADCDSENVGLPLKFSDGFEHSKLYGLADARVILNLENFPVTSNHHMDCITPKNMTSRHLLKDWKILSVNNDSNGVEFVSSVESIQFPFAGVQFHPEKCMYEWKKSQNNPHSQRAILAARHFYDWIVNEARKNGHKYPSDKVKFNVLVENYPVFYSGKQDLYFEQVYLFK